ncbi:hypothetical protein DES43_10324 [Aquamicrobium defluvii]|uniref:Uncharacterized protein n=2 Tax=Aquamicrobium defluvii TaxID=69279 RepID=A0A4R6YJA7_9HYPH|nr:hypothetical protein DES43_10324 [Aquamicrobium defluvii]
MLRVLPWLYWGPVLPALFFLIHPRFEPPSRQIGPDKARMVNGKFPRPAKTWRLCNTPFGYQPQRLQRVAFLVERGGPMGNVGFEGEARCASFSVVGMGQGTLSFSKE